MSKFNEFIYGPLMIKGEFNYIISDNCEINTDLIGYITNIDNEIETNTEIIQLFKKAIFSRIIKVDLQHTQVIVGLITMEIVDSMYQITHLSIHKLFRNQGLAKLLLCLSANYTDNEYQTVNSSISIKLSPNMVNALNLFRSLNFNEIGHHLMLISTQSFKKILESPIIA